MKHILRVISQRDMELEKKESKFQTGQFNPEAHIDFINSSKISI